MSFNKLFYNFAAEFNSFNFEKRHPGLSEVAALFSEINRELLQHVKSEEEELFPAVKEYLSSGSDKAGETIINQIRKLSAEHDFAGGAMDKISYITGNYEVPADGCNTYHVTFRLLQQFFSRLSYFCQEGYWVPSIISILPVPRQQ